MKAHLNQHSTSISKAPLRPLDSSHTTEIRLVCVEDGLDNTGFRKIASFVKKINPNTKVAYVPTANHRGLREVWRMKTGDYLNDNDIHRIAQFMAESDIAAFSSMTQSSTTVHRIIADLRRLNPHSYIVWGGCHAIIQPEDAIKHADAVCTGEGEFAFKTFLNLFKNGEDYTTAPSIWFRK